MKEQMTERDMRNLRMVKMALEENMKEEPVSYTIEEVWRDYGAGIKHTTIIAHPIGSSNWQILTPKQLDEIRRGSFTINEINKLADNNRKLIS